MGNKIATFSPKQLEEYQDCTTFTRNEILAVYRKFRAIDPHSVPRVLSPEDAEAIRIPMELMEFLSELKENPFRKRIIRVFSSDGTNEGNMSFNDFLEMFNVFSESAPRELKAHYAFRIYDFDDDGYINHADMLRTLKALTKAELEEEEVEIVLDKVFQEADIDDDGKLSQTEFEHVVTRAPDFLQTFHIRI